MRKLALVLATLLVLSGCSVTSPSGAEESRSNDSLSEESITLSDGRVVVCILYKRGYAGGLVCDWEGGK